MKCPLNSFKDCIESKCAFWVKMTGTNPQTGMPIDQWGCKEVWDTILRSEQNLVTRQNSAAINSLRNNLLNLGIGKITQKMLQMASQPDSPEAIALIDDKDMDGKNAKSQSLP